jgi:ubiquinol-cytochrome c reductase cytochrome c subunit
MKRVVTLTALAAAATACSYFTQPAPYDPPGVGDIAVPATGAGLFQRDCAWCHGAGGAGTPRAPALIGGENGPALTDFVLQTGRMPITSPEEAVRRRPPAYSREEIRKIVDFVSGFGARGPAIPDVDAAAGDIALGSALYQTNCAACHSATAIGGTLPQSSAGRIIGRSAPTIPGLRASTATEIAEAMRTGPGAMPVFGADAFSQHDVDSIVRYVLYLQRPDNEGGGDLGRIGPVAEGAVAWFAGLGALLWLARRIGTIEKKDRHA